MGMNKKQKAQKKRENAMKALKKEEMALAMEQEEISQAVEKEEVVQTVEKEESVETLEREEKTLARFVELLADLNREVVEMLKTGDLSLLYEMNDTVAEMYSIQSVNKDELYTGIDEEAKAIYQNFNGLVALTQEVGEDWSEENSAKAQAYLQNIFEANVAIVVAYGLAE